jgi:hypothetical protein
VSVDNIVRYYEFALREAEDDSEDNPVVTKLAAIVAQIYADIKDTGAKKPISVVSLLEILSRNGIELSRRDLESMIDQPPLSNLIANLQGNDVIFIDQDGKDDQGDAIDAEKSSETLKQMAVKAANEPDPLAS